MHDETRANNLLGLKDSEKVVLAAISEELQSVAQIRRKSELPRMTVFEALKSLKHRGIVERSLVGKRHFWSKIETRQATGLLQMALNTIIQKEGEKSEKLFIELYEGIDNVFGMLKNFFEKNAGERLIGIQSTVSARACINVLGQKRTIEINEIIKKESIIVEALLEGDFVDFKKEFGEDWAESYSGRSAAITFVPSGFLNVYEDVYVFKKSVLLINWQEKRALEIIHPEVVETFRKIIRAITALGKKVDINALMKEK